MTAKTVLISGTGVGGPTLAFWLQAARFEPTLLEHAAVLRTGGYVIDFWKLPDPACKSAGSPATTLRPYPRERAQAPIRCRSAAGDQGTLTLEIHDCALSSLSGVSVLKSLAS